MSRLIIGASAVALLVGVSAVAVAQSGGDVRSNDRKVEKALDHEKLTPIRPIRRVGPNDWPMGDPKNRADNVDKSKETTGQAAPDSKNEPKQDQAQQQRSEPAKQDQTKQQTPEPPQQDQAKQEPPKQQPNQQPTQNTAQQQQPAPANQQAQQGQQNNQPQQQNAQSQQATAPQAQQKNEETFASIRLGTDAEGKVAINEVQQKQIATALKRQRIRSTDVAVKVGAPPPPDVRLGSVSADIVAVLPQFRGYSFFTTRDELVIVDPKEKKVVAMIPVTSSEVASRPEREHTTERSVDRKTERAERSEPRPPAANSRREAKRETTGADIPTEEEILNAPVTGAARRAPTRIEPDDDTVVIERRHHRPRVFGIFRF